MKSGEKVTQPPEPTRNEWIFTDWYKDLNYMNTWDFATDVVAGNITLYAYWTQKANHYENSERINGMFSATVDGSGISSDATIQQGKSDFTYEKQNVYLFV